MLGRWESELRIGCENPQTQHYRASCIQPSRKSFHIIPQIYWACPPRFLVDTDWKMEAGSESQEIHIQLQRESRTIEAIYYCTSDIPLNPFVASNALDFNDDSKVPVIPLDVINDETSFDDLLISADPTVEVGEKTTQPVLHRDEVIRTAVALVALIKSKEPESQIDHELLFQLLRNPGMLDQLMKEHGFPANQNSVITHSHAHEPSSIPLPNPTPAASGYNTWSPSAPSTHSPSQGVKNMIRKIRSNSESQNPSSEKKVDLGKFRKLINEYGVHLGDERVKPGPYVVKDAAYYKRLVWLHGTSQENDKPQGSVKQAGLQEQRLCAYFNRPNGCKRGSSCQFQHVRGGLRVVAEQKGPKRMKLSGRKFARHT